MPIITLDAVSKAYQGRPLYRNVNLEVNEGDFVSFSGPNGSGKSVLFRLMCRFLSPDTGTVTIDPRFMSRGRSFPESFGILIDRPGYLPSRTGIDNLRELAAIRGVIGDDEIRATLESLGLDPALKQRVRQYSLGMKQKLALAQAFMESPKVLILDEPFNALDADAVANVKAMLRALNEQGVTIVFTSHNAQDVEELAKKRYPIENETLVAA
ncbi:ABC transporter ATP-binding protein [Leucobacter chinensis]|uniref:ABC transporter ATP-binding protein n=1 Tax=Leucobacter chinensis TaxID=2851010 RepID=UPI001C2184B8|nr:ABC transporter ATP-binding protein [Leucobacter chinensis]